MQNNEFVYNMDLIINFTQIKFVSELPKFEVISGRESHVQLPEILPGSYDLQEVVLEPEMNEL